MGPFLQDAQPPRGCRSVSWLRSGARLLSPSPLVIAFRSCADIIMRPSCATGWFYYKSNCYGYFRKLRSWSDSEVGSLARALTGFSGASGHPEPQVSLDSPGSQHPSWLSERSPGRPAFSSITDGARALGPDPRPQTGHKGVSMNEKQPLPSGSPPSVRQRCVNQRRVKRGPERTGPGTGHRPQSHLTEAKRPRGTEGFTGRTTQHTYRFHFAQALSKRSPNSQ